MPIIYKNSFLEEIDEPEEVPRSVSVPAFLAGPRSLLPEAHMTEHGSDLGSNEIGAKGVSSWADVEFEDDLIKGLDHSVLSGKGKDKQDIVKLVQMRRPVSSDASLGSVSKRATPKAKASKCKASKVKAPMSKTSRAFQDKRPHLPNKNAVSSDWWQHASMKCSRIMTSKAKEEMEDNECWICGSACCRPSECQHDSAPAMREGRFKKRRQTIDTIKSKLHYIIYMQNVAKDQRTIRSPMTPPAEDIYDIPTRLWKRKTLEWDKQLKRREWGLDAIHIEPEI